MMLNEKSLIVTPVKGGFVIEIFSGEVGVVTTNQEVLDKVVKYLEAI